MYLIKNLFASHNYVYLQTISDKLLAECRSKKADIKVVRGYLEQEDCDVNIRENDDVCNNIMVFVSILYNGP